VIKQVKDDQLEETGRLSRQVTNSDTCTVYKKEQAAVREGEREKERKQDAI
jgi:hypothetical protein